MSAEDGAEHSFAGQFDSHLNVRGADAVVERVRDCWASAFSERAVRYAFAHGISRTFAPAVVLQKLIIARSSGVVFTRNPMTGAADELVISAVYGLGEGLVSGAVDADSLILDKDTGELLDITLGDNDIRFDITDGQGCSAVAVAEDERGTRVLADAEVAELAELSRKIEIGGGTAQDIEWAIDDTGVWLLQTRPITAAAAAVAARSVELRGAGERVGPDEARIWDNSNIIESFSGITSPLTFTTAADIYGRVYRGYAASLRVPQQQLRQTDAWTPVLLGTFHGRVYYNLLHWYRMVGIAPGYPLNRRVLEAALGVAEPLPSDIAKTLRPFEFDTPAARIRSRAVTTAVYVRRLFGIDAMMADFAREFYRVYDEYDALDYTALTGERAYRAYRTVDRDLVERWGPLMVLDAILLTTTGLMFLLTKLLLPKAPEWFLYAVVGPGADVESAEPARAMIELARAVRADPELGEIINSTAPEQIHDALRAAGRTEFLTAIDDYLDRYGYRSLDELKLETPDLRENPANLFVMLRSAVGRVADTVAADRAGEADAYLDEHLGHGVRRRVYERLRARVDRCAAHRERLRFCRTRAFGMVKRMIRVMGRDLVARDVLDEFDDVFQLTVTELRGCYEGESTASLREVVAARKSLRAKDSVLVAPARFRTVGPRLGNAELSAQGWVPRTATEAAAAGTVLAGTPSAAGIVEGTAVVVGEPRDVAGGILIAYRTDPGWVAALPSASALVIERGSPLTHVAIVARELGVPTVVQLPGVTRQLRTGMRVRVDGAAGTVTVLPEGEL
ncbi:phosphoenolpyruvate synthase [Nocardia seriolae]|uniref:Phosphoenolpyruvate synthase n=1 Tax=Nocardia seriolae TaxID=37332 RepID=A0ABC9YMD3_9NOCA|nr:phosphoenolpyruvate synthase [Nocardia seriolae]WKY49510.1 phosphoenolpyruvate synthase [Nocardia seriolae]WNJ62259.1 phosphoenolpyruvate synthase [Nocardia seriolae]BAW06744.1 pyruvate water dikinase [Nocardia seriolae]BEK88678.1 phosphoenolpyruvate synthase [Nocardia seriolae]BEK96429.1 phosphoenolpyruvate synthase [Nocardia seriolae]